jgi:AcrR family transcriptional regulator
MEGKNMGTKRQPPARYWELIRAAGKLFEEKGYQGASVRDITDAVGMTSGSFFYHFATKEDVLLAVLTGGMTEGLAIVERKLDGTEGARSRLQALILGHLEALHFEHNYAHKVWLREWRQVSPEKRAPLEALSQEYRNIWLSVLENAKRENLIASDIALFRRMAVGALNWTVHWVNNPTHEQLDELAADFTCAFLNEVKPNGAAMMNIEKGLTR